MKKLLTIVAALATTLVFGQQTQENDSILVTDLDEVVVSSGRGTVDLASTRITPMAVNVVSQEEIQNKIDQNDLTTILVNTPSVFVNNQAGGFGDTEIFVRGFNQANTAFLLNGQPVNAAEDGKMYWSNWSGLGDVTQAVEIQRGLGASKLAINSVGGTVNFIMKATKMSKSKSYTLTLGSDNYRKGTYAVNTGLMDDGSAFSALIGYWQGDGYAEGTYGKGQTYFFSYGKKFSDKFEMNALLTGAPQWHDQAFEQSLADYLVHGQRYNQWWGINEDGSQNLTAYGKPFSDGKFVVYSQSLDDMLQAGIEPVSITPDVPTAMQGVAVGSGIFKSEMVDTDKLKPNAELDIETYALRGPDGKFLYDEIDVNETQSRKIHKFDKQKYLIVL